MNPYEEERPDWWRVEVGNLIANPDALRDLLDDNVMEIAFWRHACQEARDEAEQAREDADRARSIAALLESELAHLEEIVARYREEVGP